MFIPETEWGEERVKVFPGLSVHTLIGGMSVYDRYWEVGGGRLSVENR